jgi:DNA polymerase III delta prime subunit
VIETDVQPGFMGLGQSTARAIALRSAQSGRLHRTLLVHGPAGAGKASFVDDLLALLLCTDAASADRPCNACRGCRQARAHSHPDLVIGSPQRWREERGSGESIVAAARRWLLESSGSPIAGERRVVVIENVDQANEQTQNALLKVLEEPGERQMFILIADEPSRLLPTIRSRAQPLRIGAVPRGELVAWLMDRERLPADQADALARIAGGLSGRATELARNSELVAWRRRTQQELLDLLGRGTADRFGSIRDLLDAAARVTTTAPQPDDEPVSAGAQRGAAVVVIDAWLDLGRDLLVARAGRAAIAPATELLTGLEAAAGRIGQKELLACMRKLERIREGLLQNAAPKLAMEVAMLAWPSVNG